MERLEHLTDLAAQLLERTLSEPEADTKRARELSAVLKDLVSLRQNLQADTPRTLTVCFLGQAEEGSR